ncbi:MAG: RagB/SusD family nutrient uptake outer membrane protein [Prevotellaceae bacterium]|nr:RagB/SusD family nutrient uptake outer membrane protein [Prevotellaceae bacterium]
MKTITKIITRTIGIMLFAGCEIEQISYDRLTPGLYPSNYKEADDLMLGEMYTGFTPWNLLNSTQGWWARANILADEFESAEYPACYAGFDLIPGGNALTGYGGFPVSEEDNESNLPFFLYSQYIFKSVLTIERFKEVPMSDAERRLLYSQLHYGIGWLAFMEYDMYGPIPLPGLDVLLHPKDNKAVPRASDIEMQAFIEEHLKAALGESTVFENTYVADEVIRNNPSAVGLLPYQWPSTEYGRFTRGHAQMALFDYYMMMGGMKERYPNFETIDNRDAAYYWNEAEKRGRELMRPEYGYALVDDYNSLFTEATEQNTEVIYAMVCAYDLGNTFPSMCIPSDFPTPGQSMDKWNCYKMTWAFYETFEPGDVIRTERIITEYTSANGTVYNRAIDTTFSRNEKRPFQLGPLPCKIDYKTSKGMMSPVDVPIYRLGGAMLLLAEAIVRNGGDFAFGSEASNLVNEIRNRVNLAPISASSKAEFLDLVLKERGHELWFEGHRRRDLIRHDKFIEKSIEKATNAHLPPVRIAKISTLDDKGMYCYEKFPIPNRAINESGGVIKQNFGY